MPLVLIILGICLVGFVLYAVNTWFVWMDPMVKRFLQIAVLVLLIWWLLNVTGMLGTLMSIRV